MDLFPNSQSGQQATKYKKIIDALPVFCVDKGYKFINDVIWTNTKLPQASFLSTYPDLALSSSTYHVQIHTVNPAAIPDAQTLRCAVITNMQEEFHIFNPNLQKRLLSEYNLKCKLKLQEWSKLTSDKKSLMTIIYGQCKYATRTEIALGTNYKIIRANAELINFLAILRTVCYGSDDGGLSFKPYKNVVVVKSLNNFINAKPNDPHGFKEELKIK